MKLKSLWLALLLPVVVTCGGCKKAEDVKGNSSGAAEVQADIPAPQSPNQVHVWVVGNANMNRTQLKYTENMANKILTAWRPVPANRKYLVSCELLVTRPGYCSNVHPVGASANQKSIEKALDTVRMQAPFGPLPADFKDAPVEFKVDLIYNPSK